MAKQVAFQGFSKDLPKFLGELARNNKKEWFDDNRKRYEAIYLNAAKDFVAAIAPGLRKISKNLHAEPRVNGSIMRINRDIRFSNDKTPYNKYMRLMFPEGPKFDRRRPCLFFGLESKKLVLGGGLYGMESIQLGAFRNALVDKKAGPAFQRAIKKLKGDGLSSFGGKHYKRTPKGFPTDHPNTDYLLHNGIYVTVEGAIPEAFFTQDAVDHCIEAYKRVRPLQKWLNENL